MNQRKISRWNEIVRYGVLAGIAGGFAEILWIAGYGALTGIDSAEVARGVTTVVGAAFPVTLMITQPVASGIAIHMILAVGLGIALVFFWHALAERRFAAFAAVDPYSFMFAALAIVWGINFFVVLPQIGPSFTELVPYPVSLMSKLLFGLAAAAVLKREASGQPALVRG
jgi:hypothetical protein